MYVPFWQREDLHVLQTHVYVWWTAPGRIETTGWRGGREGVSERGRGRQGRRKGKREGVGGKEEGEGGKEEGERDHTNIPSY